MSSITPPTQEQQVIKDLLKNNITSLIDYLEVLNKTLKKKINKHNKVEVSPSIPTKTTKTKQ